MSNNNHNDKKLEDDSDFFEPVVYGKSLTSFVAERIYDLGPEIALREMIANSQDQYLDESTKNHSLHNVIWIVINPMERTFTLIDYATGIQEMDNFKLMGSEEEGKTVGNLRSTYDNPHESMAGIYHVGKFSYIKMSNKKDGDVVTFRSNNGEKGEVISLRFKNKGLGWSKGYTYPSEHAHLVRPTIGLTVTVYDVVDELLNIPYVRGIVSDVFGIRLRRHHKIFITNESKRDKNGERIWEQIMAPSELNTKGEIHNDPQMRLKDGSYISYCFDGVSKPKHYENVRVCKNHIKLKDMHYEHCVKGWFDHPGIHPNGAKSAPVNDEIWREIKGLVDRYMDAHFEKQHSGEAIKMTGTKDMMRLLADLYKNAIKLFDQDALILTGPQNLKSEVRGLIVDAPDAKGKWAKVEGQQLTKDGGGEDSSPVIPIGEGHRRGGGRYEGEGGNQPGIKPGGTRTVMMKEMLADDGDDRTRTGPISIVPEIVTIAMGENEPMTLFSDGGKMLLNTDQKAVRRLLRIPTRRRIPMLSPWFAEAIVEFIVMRRKEPTDIKTFRNMTAALYTGELEAKE